MGDSNTVYSEGEKSESVDGTQSEGVGLDQTVTGTKAERNSRLQTSSGVSLQRKSAQY